MCLLSSIFRHLVASVKTKSRTGGNIEVRFLPCALPSPLSKVVNLQMCCDVVGGASTGMLPPARGWVFRANHGIPYFFNHFNSDFE